MGNSEVIDLSTVRERRHALKLTENFIDQHNEAHKAQAELLAYIQSTITPEQFHSIIRANSFDLSFGYERQYYPHELDLDLSPEEQDRIQMEADLSYDHNIESAFRNKVANLAKRYPRQAAAIKAKQKAILNLNKSFVIEVCDECPELEAFLMMRIFESVFGLDSEIIECSILDKLHDQISSKLEKQERKSKNWGSATLVFLAFINTLQMYHADLTICAQAPSNFQTYILNLLKTDL
jgi:hypothetical protein